MKTLQTTLSSPRAIRSIREESFKPFYFTPGARIPPLEDDHRQRSIERTLSLMKLPKHKQTGAYPISTGD